MPIVNTSVSRLFRSPPALNATQIGNLTLWLKVANQPDFSRRSVQAQQEMLSALVESERITQEITAQRAVVLDSIRNLKSAAEMDAVRVAQRLSTDLSSEAAAHGYYRRVVRLIGDHMAQRIIEDPDIVKGFGLKQRSGFVSGKDGLKSELEAFAHFLQKGYIVLLNDITACVRAGDLTLRKGQELRFFEVKASATAYETRETQAQILGPMIVQDYVKTDTMRVKLGDQDAAAIRLDSPPEALHYRVAGELLKGLRRNGGYRALNRGAKTYLASWRSSSASLRTRLEEMTATGDWVVANMATRVLRYHDLPPFTQWIRPDHAIAIASGELIVISAYRLEEMKTLAETARIAISWKATGTDEFPMHYEPMDPSELEPVPGGHFMMWHRLRISYTTLGVEDFVAKLVSTFSAETLAQIEAKRPAATKKPLVHLNPSGALCRRED